MKFKDLPPLGGQLDEGIFAGLTTKPDGTHCAVVLLPGKSRRLNWIDAKAWATAQGGELPRRPVSALLVATVKDHLHQGRHWTSDEAYAVYAWTCYFNDGSQYFFHKDCEYSAVAVRLIPIAA